MRPRRFILALALFSLAPPAHAQLQVGVGTQLSFWEIMNRIIGYMVATISAVAVAMFLIGALMITVSGVKEDYKQKGKDLMIAAVISLTVVLGAFALLRFVGFILR